MQLARNYEYTRPIVNGVPHIRVFVCVYVWEGENKWRFLSSVMKQIFLEKDFLFHVIAGMGCHLLACRRDVFLKPDTNSLPLWRHDNEPFLERTL